MYSPAAVALTPRLAAILRLDMPAAHSLSTSRILRMGNLGPGMSRSLWKRSEAMPIRGSPNGARHPPSTGGRDRPESVVAIRRNGWPRSIGMSGRDQSESLVAIFRCAQLGRWLKPFLDQLGHKARRQMCPLYVSGLIGPGERKSVQPMAKRLALGACDQLHHFIAAGVWDAAPVETELLVQADRLVGGGDAVLVIDDTAIPKKGMHSVGVAAQYASALGKTANCQTLVSLTLARGEVPVMLALRLFLPESWTSNRARLK